MSERGFWDLCDYNDKIFFDTSGGIYFVNVFFIGLSECR
jgi:hypothetical protein